MTEKVYLDSCVWIDYLWVKHNRKRGRLPQRKQKTFLKIDKIQQQHIDFVITPLVIHEISKHFKEHLLWDKIKSDGYSIKQFTTRLKSGQYHLSSNDKEKLDNYILQIKDIKNAVVSPYDLSESDLEQIFKIYDRCNLDYIDATHLFLAKEFKVKYFVTSDEEFKKELIIKYYPSFKKIKLCKPDEFWSIYQQTISKR